MTFVFSKLMSALHKDGGPSFVDSLWSDITNELKNNPAWKEYGEKMMSQALKEFFTNTDNFDESDPEQAKKLEKFMNESPRGVQSPVWSRWQSVSVNVPTHWACSRILILLVALSRLSKSQPSSLTIMSSFTSWPWVSGLSTPPNDTCAWLLAVCFR